jgi:hypothetical protein
MRLLFVDHRIPADFSSSNLLAKIDEQIQQKFGMVAIRWENYQINFDLEK